ncbi:MAG: OsmC family protein [Candidatus Bathyarchaeota archaeon]|nr:OsmC family protein [Candidatus Bathyarchaeota archaeon]
MTIKVTRINGMKMQTEENGLTITAGTVNMNTLPDAMSPGRIMVASLGMCAWLHAAWYLKRHGIEDDGLEVTIDVRNERKPGRATEFLVNIHSNAYLDERKRKGMMAEISRCYVGNTMNGIPKINYVLHPEPLEAPAHAPSITQ